MNQLRLFQFAGLLSMGIQAGAETLLHPKILDTKRRCNIMPRGVVQALNTTISADVALEVASVCLSTTAFVTSAVYLQK